MLEGRRLRAVDLLALGLRPAEVARRVHCHPSSVIRWRDTVERHGRSGLKAKPIPGRPWKLTKTQCARLVDILRKGAVARGYATEVWTTLRIAEAVKEMTEGDFGFHPIWKNHVNYVREADVEKLKKEAGLKELKIEK